MSNDLQTAPTFPVIEYPIADAAIQALAEEYLTLGIDGPDDTPGFERVHEARMTVRRKRTDVEKTRKALKADALEYGKKVDAEAKRLTALMEPIEGHLKDQEDRYNAERDRIKREAAERRQAELKAWVDKFAAVGVSLTTYEVEATPADQLQTRFNEAEAQYAAKLAEEAAEKRRRKLAMDRHNQLVALSAPVTSLEELADMPEAEWLTRLHREQAAHADREQERVRLEQERRRLDEQRQQQEAKEAEIRAERERQEAEQRERERQAERERIEREAKERAEREAKERAEREAAEAQAKAEADEAERLRLEALRPDYEKLIGVAETVEAIVVPEISDDALMIASEIKMLLHTTARHIRKSAERLTLSKAG